MPTRCSIAGCRSNYDGETGYTPVFSLPKNKALRSQWLRNIPTDFKGLKNPAICVKHFEKEAIIWEDEVLVRGEIKKYPRKIPKYKEGSIPRIFPYSSKYLKKTAKMRRRSINDAEQKKFDHAVAENIEETNESEELNTICNFNDIVSYLKERKNESKAWVVLKNQTALALCFMNTNIECPVVAGCVTVAENLEFIVYLNSIKIGKHRLPIKERHLSSVSALEDILSFVEKESLSQDSILDGAIRLLNLLSNYTDDS